MAIVVTASNILVRYPVGDFLTYGAFTYPIAFLVTDLTNKLLGAQAARKVVLAGFAVGIVLSAWLAVPRIAIASGTAFMVAQMLDVAVFNRLREGSWWRAPLVSSLFGSAVDTALFFSMAFAAAFVFLGPNEEWALAPAPLMGIGTMAPFWVSLAIGDFMMKLGLALAALVPFRALANYLAPAAKRQAH
ncbi:MAG: queuosine precursor transporter [Hyphomicrobiales bacterium]